MRSTENTWNRAHSSKSSPTDGLNARYHKAPARCEQNDPEIFQPFVRSTRLEMNVPNTHDIVGECVTPSGSEVKKVLINLPWINYKTLPSVHTPPRVLLWVIIKQTQNNQARIWWYWSGTPHAPAFRAEVDCVANTLLSLLFWYLYDIDNKKNSRELSFFSCCPSQASHERQRSRCQLEIGVPSV